jgi:hypothetical protein
MFDGAAAAAVYFPVSLLLLLLVVMLKLLLPCAAATAAVFGACSVGSMIHVIALQRRPEEFKLKAPTPKHCIRNEVPTFRPEINRMTNLGYPLMHPHATLCAGCLFLTVHIFVVTPHYMEHMAMSRSCTAAKGTAWLRLDA